MAKTDWNKMKSEFIQGKSYREISEQYGVSFSTIQKKGSEGKWTDLRKKSNRKAEEKMVSSVAKKKANDLEIFSTIADKLLAKINEGIDNGSLMATQKGIRDITGALKDLRDIKGIKSDADMREQEARINKLIKDAEENKQSDGDDERYGIFLMPSINEDNNGESSVETTEATE